MSVEEKQLRFLTQWLKEYRLDQSLSGVDAAMDVVDDGRCRKADEYDSAIAAGQIRLLSRSLTEGAERPIYVVVVRMYDELKRLWNVVPFSGYSVPAVPHELLLRQQDSLALRVVCVWNSRTVAEELLSRSWLVDELQDEERTLLDDFAKACVEPQTMHDEIREQSGPPIVKWDDPRHDYIEKEQELLDGLSHDGAEPVNGDDAPEENSGIYTIAPQPLKRVAEDKPRYGRKPPKKDN